MGLGLRAARDDLHTHIGSDQCWEKALMSGKIFLSPNFACLLLVPFYATASSAWFKMVDNVLIYDSSEDALYILPS
jgi:hypothetical protein